MSYSTTPELLMQLAVPGSGQQFETTVVNDNFTKLDARAAADKTSLDSLVANFAITDTATTLAAILAAPSGSVRSVSANGSVWRWTGSVWRLLNVPVVASAAARDALYVAPVAVAQGDSVFRTDLGYAEIYDGSAWVRVGKPGLIQITPTSVSGTGVTVGPTGLVSLSATTNAAPAIVSGAFLSQFKQVKILLDLSNATAFGLQFQLRAGATTNTVSYYRTSHRAVGTTPSAVQTLNSSGWEMVVAIVGQQVLELTVTSAAAAAVTHAVLHTESTDTPMTAAAGIGVAALQHNVATAFDGFVLTPSAGTMSGTVAIYGYVGG